MSLMHGVAGLLPGLRCALDNIGREKGAVFDNCGVGHRPLLRDVPVDFVVGYRVDWSYRARPGPRCAVRDVVEALILWQRRCWVSFPALVARSTPRAHPPCRRRRCRDRARPSLRVVRHLQGACRLRRRCRVRLRPSLRGSPGGHRLGPAAPGVAGVSARPSLRAAALADRPREPGQALPGSGSGPRCAWSTTMHLSVIPRGRGRGSSRPSLCALHGRHVLDRQRHGVAGLAPALVARTTRPPTSRTLSTALPG
jgi:hypothetical protein